MPWLKLIECHCFEKVLALCCLFFKLLKRFRNFPALNLIFALNHFWQASNDRKRSYLDQYNSTNKSGELRYATNIKKTHAFHMQLTRYLNSATADELPVKSKFMFSLVLKSLITHPNNNSISGEIVVTEIMSASQKQLQMLCIMAGLHTEAGTLHSLTLQCTLRDHWQSWQSDLMFYL